MRCLCDNCATLLPQGTIDTCAACSLLPKCQKSASGCKYRVHMNQKTGHGFTKLCRYHISLSNVAKKRKLPLMQENGAQSSTAKLHYPLYAFRLDFDNDIRPF